MCFGSSSRGNRSGRSQSPPPRPALRRPRHTQDISDPASSFTRHRQRQRGPEVIRHHARRSSALVFEGEPSSAVPTLKRRSRKGSDEPKTGRSRNRRHRRRTTHIRRRAGDIPKDAKDMRDLEDVEEDVEDADPSIEISIMRKQGKQPESKSEDEDNTKDEASKPPLHSEKGSSEITKKTAENVQIESSKAAVNNTAAQQPLIENQNLFKNIKAAGQTDDQKAAAARKQLPEAKKPDDDGKNSGSKAKDAANTAAQPIVENQNLFKNIEATGQTDAQKAAAARKLLPEVAKEKTDDNGSGNKAAANTAAQPVVEDKNLFETIKAAGQTDAQKPASSDMPVAKHSSGCPPAPSSSSSSSSSSSTTRTTTGIPRSNGGKNKNKSNKEKKGKKDDADDDVSSLKHKLKGLSRKKK